MRLPIVTIPLVLIIVQLCSAATLPTGTNLNMVGTVLHVGYLNDYPGVGKYISVKLRKQNTTDEYIFGFPISSGSAEDANRVMSILLSARNDGGLVTIYYDYPYDRGDGYTYGRIKIVGADK